MTWLIYWIYSTEETHTVYQAFGYTDNTQKGQLVIGFDLFMDLLTFRKIQIIARNWSVQLFFCKICLSCLQSHLVQVFNHLIQQQL